MTEIKIDRSTLPKDGEKIRWQTQTDLNNDTWREGVFCEGDDQFCQGFDKSTSMDKIDFVWDVYHWEPLSVEPKNIVVTEKYRRFNHHHELTNKHELVDFGDGEFIANKEAIPLLKALKEVGLRTRSHHIDDKKHAWVCVLLDNVSIEVRDVFEGDACRTKYNGKKELLINWVK